MPNRQPKKNKSHGRRGNFIQGDFPNNSLFPGNCVKPPSGTLDTNEMFNRFSQLFDWQLPQSGNNVGGNEPPFGGDLKGPQEEYSDERYSPRFNDSYDLRSVLDHNKWKESGDYSLNRKRRANSFEMESKRRYEPDSVSLNPWHDYAEHGTKHCSDSYDKDDSWDTEKIHQDNDSWSSKPAMSSGWTASASSMACKKSLDGGNRSGPFTSRDYWEDDQGHDSGRKVKEYWPDRNNPKNDGDKHQGNYYRDHDLTTYSSDRVDTVVERSKYYREPDVVNEMNPHLQGGSKQFERMKGNFHSWDREPPVNKFDGDFSSDTAQSRKANTSYRYSPIGTGLRSQSPRWDSDGNYQTSTTMPTKPPFENRSSDDLVVWLYKIDDSKFSFSDGDSLRNSIIDLVLTNGNPEQMPEFIRSGVVRSGKAFYIVCRTRDTLNWLLKQKIPPLNGKEIVMKQNNYVSVKVSTFAPRCTRGKVEILKLLKLQNGKKGLNFDDWSLRSYKPGPKGIYLAFDISSDEALTLREIGSQLSFEMKVLNFKISAGSNIHSY